jgi:hypothetical protein
MQAHNTAAIRYPKSLSEWVDTIRHIGSFKNNQPELPYQLADYCNLIKPYLENIYANHCPMLWDIVNGSCEMLHCKSLDEWCDRLIDLLQPYEEELIRGTPQTFHEFVAKARKLFTLEDGQIKVPEPYHDYYDHCVGAMLDVYRNESEYVKEYLLNLSYFVDTTSLDEWCNTGLHEFETHCQSSKHQCAESPVQKAQVKTILKLGVPFRRVTLLKKA